MNKELFDNPRIYPKVVLWWGNKDSENEVVLYDKSLKDAYNTAIAFGYNPPVWYKPWQYFTGGLGVMTVGIGVEK
jgi:hypothetical protein